MNFDPLSSILLQVEYLVSSLNKKTLKSVSADLHNLTQHWGRETEVHILRCLLSSIDNNGDSRTSLKETAYSQCLKEVFLINISKPDFSSNFCNAFDSQVKNFKASSANLAHFSKTLRLSRVLEVAFALILLQSSKTETRNGAFDLLKKKLPELLNFHINPDTSRETGIYDCSVELIHHLLLSVLKNPQFGVSSDLIDSFIDSLKKDFPQIRVPAVISPFLYRDSVNQDLTSDLAISRGLNIVPPGLTSSSPSMDFSSLSSTSSSSIIKTITGSLALQIQEIGYPFCQNVDVCKKHLTSLGVQTLTPSNVAHILAMMVRTHSNLKNGGPLADVQPSWLEDNKESEEPSTWKAEIFVQVVLGMVPNMNWHEVVAELDHPGFAVKDRQGLILLTRALLVGLRDQPFPISALYAIWANKEGQLSWIQQVLRNPDIFCFTDYHHRVVQAGDIVKFGPDESREVYTWKSLDLVDTLLTLGEVPGLSSFVQECFRFPVQSCPALLALGLMQSQLSMSVFRQELLIGLFQLLLAGQTKEKVFLVFNFALNGMVGPHQNQLRQCVLHAMAEWYNRNADIDDRLTRIFQIATKFKILLDLLSLPQYQFTIDLACLASRCDFVNLNRWLTEKIQAHGEPFVQACVQFLKRRFPALSGYGSSPIVDQTRQTVSSILMILQNVVSHVSSNLAGEIAKMYSQYTVLASGGSSGALATSGLVQSSVAVAAPQPAAPVPTPSLPVVNSTPNLTFASVSQQPTHSSVSPLNVAVGAHTNSNMYNDPVASWLKPAVTGWGAGFSTSHAVNSNPMIQTQRPMPSHIPQSLTATVNEPSAPDITQTFPDDVQEEANGYFQQIYTQPPQPSMSIEQFLDVLKRFRESSDKKQLDVFACMIKNLFEEYSFFEQYPEKELHTTALLFGGVIREGLVSGTPLLFALRVVMEALKKDPASNRLHGFGLIALEQFKARLKEYPRYCQTLLNQLPRLQQLPSKLLEYIQYGLREEWPPGHQTAPLTRSDTPGSQLSTSAGQIFSAPGAPTSTVQPTTTTTSTNTFTAATSSSSAPKPAPTLNATNIDTLVHATAKEDSKVAVPVESIVEKVAFLFNNLSQMNMTQKVTEMKSLISDDFLPWLAQYLVMKRVSAEANFHNLYANFVTALNNKQLNAIILKETYRNIKILLRSDKAAANFSDRTLLKNLGHWLGMITLMNNKPILYMDLDVKSLLLEAFWKGQQELLYVVPFVAKILESCQKSKVFKPPNPWTKAILNVLGELHQQPDLKLNLKFEIEVLCRHLNVELSSLKITNILKDPVVMERAMKEPQLSNPVRLEKPTMANTLQPSPVPPATVGTVISTAIPTIDEQTTVAQPSSVTPTPTAARFSYHDIFVNNYGFQGLIPHISVNASLPIFQVNPPLKHLVKPAIEHAVHELMVPVADRAIKVAMTTTENVIKKDFSLDADETRLRLAAQNMARSLTAGMAMITCRDPLQYGIQTYLKQGFYSSIRGATTEQQRMIEEAVQAITDDNVELAQCFIVKFAAERASVEIDKRLLGEFDIRRQARLENRQYFDAPTAKYQAERVPDNIRLKIGPPSQQQLSVYEEFGKNIPGFKPSTNEDLFVSFQQTAVAAAANRHFWPPNGGAGQQVSVGAPGAPAVQHVPEDEMVFQHLLRDVEARLQLAQPHIAQTIPPCQGLVALREALVMAPQNPRENMGAQALLQKLVEIMLEYFMPRLIPHQSVAEATEWKEWNQVLSEGFLSAIKNFNFIFGNQWVQKQVTKTLIDCRQERQDSRFNVDAIDLLIRNQLVNMITYDLQLANSMDNGLNYKAVEFAQHLVRRIFVDERTPVLHESDLSNTIDTLQRITNTRMTTDGASFRPNVMSDFFGPGGVSSMANTLMNAPSQPFAPNMAPSASSVLSQLGVVTPSSNITPAPHAAAAVRAPFATHLESGMMFVRDFSGNDPPGLQEKAEFMLREWVNMQLTPAATKDPQKALSAIISQMHQQGILKSDDSITRFFRLCTEMCVDLCYRGLSDTASSPTVVRARCFHTLDAFVLLIALLVKHSSDGSHATKISLLNKVLGIIAGVLMQDYKVRREEFHQLPFHRIFITLFLELTSPDPALEPIQMDILAAFCHALHMIQPRSNPAFTFAWLDILGHRAFIGRVLVHMNNQRAWSMYAQLLTDHLKFLAPFLRNIEFQKPINLVYKGTLRILLVLLHDLPELLCDFHYPLCDVIPPNCVQLRNLILSAYPRNMRLPDPFVPNLKVDQLPEINNSPRISVTFAQVIQPASLKNDLDNYLKNRAPVSFLSELRSKLQISNEPGQKYNISLINAVVLYVGVQAIQAIQAKEQPPSISTIAHTAHMDIFQNLAVDLDSEGRYLFFNAIANQLRYPNSHTHYFSCTLLYLFAEANSVIIQEQITRILFERLVALRPHPWGLLITFIELIKNPYYKFWPHEFTRCAPEIESLFESVARSCNVVLTKHIEAP